MYILSLDIGGTKTSCALFDRYGQIVDGYVSVTPSVTYSGEENVYQNTKRALCGLLERFGVRPGDIAALGVGGPGPLDHQQGLILHAPMMGWRNFPLTSRLMQDFPFPAFLDNDANLGALAEQRVGVAFGKRFVAYMTVSTGIGGGLVLDGKIFHGNRGGAGEFGHMSLYPDGPQCPCGNHGCLELYASGTAIARRLQADRASGVASAYFTSLPPDASADARLLACAAAEGDAYALREFEEVGAWLGVAIVNLFHLLDIETLVLGGGVTKASGWFAPSMYRTIESRCIHPFERNQVMFSQLNDHAVLHGAFYMASERLQGVKDTQ